MIQAGRAPRAAAAKTQILDPPIREETAAGFSRRRLQQWKRNLRSTSRGRPSSRLFWLIIVDCIVLWLNLHITNTTISTNFHGHLSQRFRLFGRGQGHGMLFGRLHSPRVVPPRWIVPRWRSITIVNGQVQTTRFQPRAQGTGMKIVPTVELLPQVGVVKVQVQDGLADGGNPHVLQGIIRGQDCTSILFVTLPEQFRKGFDVTNGGQVLGTPHLGNLVGKGLEENQNGGLLLLLPLLYLCWGSGSSSRVISTLATMTLHRRLARQRQGRRQQSRHNVRLERGNAFRARGIPKGRLRVIVQHDKIPFVPFQQGLRIGCANVVVVGDHPRLWFRWFWLLMLSRGTTPSSQPRRRRG
mmetsp:Transcript_2041/g.5642  ORF Transcript_2041/g.5642 Transcript_2041/m.5642 type:complete len:355 (+) Transcript_2041:1487-2551(+)